MPGRHGGADSSLEHLVVIPRHRSAKNAARRSPYQLTVIAQFFSDRVAVRFDGELERERLSAGCRWPGDLVSLAFCQEAATTQFGTTPGRNSSPAAKNYSTPGW